MATSSQASFLLGLPTSMGPQRPGSVSQPPRTLRTLVGEEVPGHKKRAGPPSAPSENPSTRPTHQSWGLTWNCCVQILHLDLSLHLEAAQFFHLDGPRYPGSEAGG